MLEPSLAQLLPPTCFVKVHDQVRLLGVEIRRRIVECKMAVLPDADECNVYRMFLDNRTEPFAFRLGVVFPIDVMKGLQRQRKQPVEPLPKIMAK